MYFKSVVMIIFLTALGAGMLSLRQQRWEVRHDITRMHQQIEQTRRATWDSQSKVAADLQTDKLEHKIAVAQIEMEPITASTDPALRRVRVLEKANTPTNTKSKNKAKSTASKSKGKRAG